MPLEAAARTLAQLVVDGMTMAELRAQDMASACASLASTGSSGHATTYAGGAMEREMAPYILALPAAVWTWCAMSTHRSVLTGLSGQAPTMHTTASETSPVRPALGKGNGRGLAVLAESLYLVNLLLAPGLAFAVLVWLWLRHRHSAPPLARSHLRQATFVSVVAGVLIACLSGVIVSLGGWRWPWTWVAVLTYFVCIHGALVLLGMFALAKAMAGKAWRYPVVGPRED